MATVKINYAKEALTTTTVSVNLYQIFHLDLIFCIFNNCAIAMNKRKLNEIGSVFKMKTAL